ncbi:MAG TPA: L-2-hydroxyglutarate oxidase [Gaiellaceae bacterium]|jgi:L-2-hydroxyglutarate oxidase LhgO|nr:L-2-hydroxyglutarate oxidase [Gaiellaceae bacterium]
MNSKHDVLIVGAGIIGLATARALLLERPNLRVLVVDKEHGVGFHQTGHNSGVLHGGVYYMPGSLKAALCIKGKDALERYADEKGISLARRGKLIIAVDESELGRLAELGRRATANGVRGIREVGGSEIVEIEPNAIGIRALHAPETAVIDYGAVARALADDVRSLGGSLQLGTAVTSVSTNATGVVAGTDDGTIEAKHLIGCAGLQSDRLASLAGLKPSARIVPFRGDYYTLRPSAAELVRGLIYPVPDPAFPFLGVHFTRKHDASVVAGPNAVLALAREGYRRLAFRPRDAASSLTYTGLWRFALKHGRIAAAEAWRDFSKGAFVSDMQRYVPAVRGDDAIFGPSGIRAQAMTPQGRLVDDFLIEGTSRLMLVLNAPSPGATASLAIGEELAQRAFRDLVGR